MYVSRFFSLTSTTGIVYTSFLCFYLLHCIGEEKIWRLLCAPERVGEENFFNAYFMQHLTAEAPRRLEDILGGANSACALSDACSEAWRIESGGVRSPALRLLVGVGEPLCLIGSVGVDLSRVRRPGVRRRQRVGREEYSIL